MPSYKVFQIYCTLGVFHQLISHQLMRRKEKKSRKKKTQDTGSKRSKNKEAGNVPMQIVDGIAPVIFIVPGKTGETHPHIAPGNLKSEHSSRGYNLTHHFNTVLPGTFNTARHLTADHSLNRVLQIFEVKSFHLLFFGKARFSSHTFLSEIENENFQTSCKNIIAKM